MGRPKKVIPISEIKEVPAIQIPEVIVEQVQEENEKKNKSQVWKRSEREIASLLSKWFESLGEAPVKRVPILGREGPDISINNMEIVVEAKRRLQNPIGYLMSSDVLYRPPLIGVALYNLDKIELIGTSGYERHTWERGKPSITVNNWYSHMDKWRADYRRHGITFLILHFPYHDVSCSSVFFAEKDLPRLQERIRKAREDNNNKTQA